MNPNELLSKIREHIKKGTYVICPHAVQRQDERLISLNDILYVLKYGTHEQNKDLFNVKRQMWKYAIRGKTTESILLRVIVAFEEEMVIITVMRIK